MKLCLSCEGIAATELDKCEHCGLPLLPTEAAHFPVRRGEVDAANPLLGTVIDGKFLLRGVLGRGGMGTVFRASHTVSLVPVALKLLHPRLSARAEYRRALLAEARKAGRVVHDHCARVLDVGETEEGTVYLAMELAEGETLDNWVRGRGLPPALAVDLLAQVCRALLAIHAAGLVHRDLSSRNVMVAIRGGRPAVKVLDFGIAQSLALAPRPGDEPRGEMAFANPVFSAPEQLAGQEVDARADLYSLGVIAYLMLTGRLPVDEHDARAAAQATIAGQLLPLPPLPGAPRRLLRLVQRCLARDPAQRPASAAAVLAELATIERGRFPGLPRASLVLLGAAVVAAVVAFGQGAPPFLRLIGGQLQLTDAGLAPDSEVRWLQSRELQTLSARFGGFRPEQLEVEVARDKLLQHWPLRPAIDRDGVLVLSTAQNEWREALAGIAEVAADAPVDVAFVLPGRAVLGSARLQLDDLPPQLDARLEPAPGGRAVLRGDSQLRWQVADRGLAELGVTVRLASGLETRIDLAPGKTAFALGARLAAVWREGGPLGRGELRLCAVDRAGNRTETAPIGFADCDLAAPSVVEVTGPENEATIPYVEEKARLRLRLSAVEPGLRLTVIDPGGKERDLAAPPAFAAGGYCTLELAAAAAPAEPFADGPYTFVVEDALGNRTESTPPPLVFRSRRLDVALAPAGLADPVAIAGDEVVTGPAGGAIELVCNPLFAATVTVRPAGNAPAAEGALVRSEPLGRGRLRVTVGALAPGAYRFAVDLEETGAGRGDRAHWERPLRVLPAVLSLRLPDTDARFLKPLLARGLFELQGDMLQDGGAFRIDPELGPYVRGRLWVGADPMALSPVELPEHRAGERILPPVRLGTGRNVLALELRDVLGRPVAVQCEEKPARRLRQGGRDLDLLADFWHDTAPPQQIGGELRVEYEQDARLRLRCGLPFAAADLPALKLGIGSVELAAKAVRSDGPAGAEVEFVLPFPAWSTAADLRDYSRADFAKGIQGRIVAELDTPAGSFPVRAAVRTARTTLRALQLADAGDARPSGGLAALAALRLVPVLAPADGVFPDPVPPSAPGRQLFRPQQPLDVRNCRDFFVQDREFTLGQYAALLAALPRPEQAPAALVHADDPLGRRRLERANMVPAAWQDDPAAFAAAAAGSPGAAVTGVDFFQAFTAARLVGFLCAGDATLLRLPLGCELELAAFGADPPGDARHGAAAHGGRIDRARWFAARDPRDGRRVGPTADEETAVGDFVPSAFGAPIRGLDFGVREWVLDLPQGVDSDPDALLREWIADREQHCQRALQLAATGSTPVDLPAELQARLRTFGVVRGLPFGARTGLLGTDGAPVARLDGSALPAAVPGVVRSEQLRRDGRDIAPGAVDPRLWTIGFRVAGGAEFVARVRGR